MDEELALFFKQTEPWLQFKDNILITLSGKDSCEMNAWVWVIGHPFPTQPYKVKKFTHLDVHLEALPMMGLMKLAREWLEEIN